MKLVSRLCCILFLRKTFFLIPIENYVTESKKDGWLVFNDTKIIIADNRFVCFHSELTAGNSTSSLVQGNQRYAKLNKIISQYDRKIRPNTGGPATHVQVEMKIISFGPINEIDQTYKLDLFFRQWWFDPTLVGAVNSSLTMAIDVGALFWKPDTYFVNAKDPQFQYVTKEAMRVLLKPDGNIYHSARITLEANCPMDFTLYPMDVQHCPLVIESYSYTTDDIYYSWYESVGKLKKTKGVEWLASQGPSFQLVNVSTQQKHISNNSKGAFSSLKVKFHLARRRGYYVWNTYLPGGFLVVMTWVNFWIPPWAYPARVTVCVTSFLSTLLVMSAASQQLGRVSYIKAIDYFLMGNATFVLLSLLEYMLVLRSWWNIDFDRLNCLKNKFKKKSNHKFGSQAGLGTIHENYQYAANQNGGDKETGAMQLQELSKNGSFGGERGKNDSINENKQYGMAENVFQMSRRNLGLDKTPASRQRRSSTILAMKQFQEQYDLTPEQAKKAHPLDVISRFIFPISYAVFVISYFSYYKMF